MPLVESKDLIRIFKEARNIAVVGLSPNPYRSSHGIGGYLLNQGYNVIGVNPNYPEVLGRKCYPSLRAVPEPVDIVNVFRNPDDLMPVVEDAIAIGARILWLQLGVVNDKAIDKALAAGMEVVVDRCIATEHTFRRRELNQATR